MRLRRDLVVAGALGLVLACGAAPPPPLTDVGAPPPPASMASVPAAPVAGGPAAPSPAPANAVGPAPSKAQARFAEVRKLEDLYLPEDAIADVLAEPLTFVGKGGWYGLARHLACAYRNQRVLVVDVYCDDREGPAFSVEVFSPTKGHVTIYAEARRPISRAARKEYQAFTVRSEALPLDEPRLELGMSYAQLVSYYERTSKRYPPECDVGNRGEANKGGCTDPIRELGAQYQAALAPFLDAPPESWQRLVRALVATRATNGATITPDALVAWSDTYTQAHGISLSSYQLKHVGNSSGMLAAAAGAPDGGLILIGTKADAPVVVRLDARGKLRWQRALGSKRFGAFEGSAVAPHPGGGFIALVLAYPKAMLSPVMQLVRLSDKGVVVWSWTGRGDGGLHTPFAQTARITDSGNIVMEGHVYEQKGAIEHGWLGEVDAKGTLVRDEVGAPDPYKRADASGGKR